MRLTPNFNKHLLKIIFSIPAVWDPANLDPAMMKIMGALAAVNQVIFPETPGDGAGQTPALDFRLASRHASSGGELAVVTAFGKKSKDEKKKKGKWKKDWGKKYYYDSDGDMVKGEFRKIDGEWYYFHEDGHMARDEFVHYENHTYYFDKKGHMQDDDVFQKKDETYYINDFKFTGTGSKRRENEALAEEMMFYHQQYHISIEENPYVTQGSILACTKGTNLTRLDARTAVDIRDVATGLPVLGCDACKADENIYSFYGCRASDLSNTPARPVIAGGYKKCIPMLGMWTQPHQTSIIWNSVSGDHTETLIFDSVILCRFGGMIGVVEIPEEEMGPEGIYDLNGMNVDQKALKIMEKKYRENEHIKEMVDGNGLSIFAMEGLGENSGKGIPELFPNGRYGAELVVTKGNVVQFVTRHASTLPSTLELEERDAGIAIVKEGVYFIFSKRHQQRYAAFAVAVEDLSGYTSMPVIRKKIGEPWVYDSTASGINIHTAPNDTGPLYSEGCQMIRSKDYIDFLFATGLTRRDDRYANFLRGISIDESLLFRGENLYPTGRQTRMKDEDGDEYNRIKYGMKGPDGEYAWYIELLEEIGCDFDENNLITGYYVLDRTYMPGSQKEKFYL